MSKVSRIRELRRQRGLTQAALAEACGTTHGTINKLETGKMRLTAAWIEAVAAALGVTPSEILADGETEIAGDRRLANVFVRGTVQAGAWTDAPEWDPALHYMVTVPVTGRCPPEHRFAVEVRGPSMNVVYPEGSILVCERIDPYGEADFVEGRRYIVQRIDPAGNYETTVKELRFRDGRVYLWPRSEHPDHQAPIALDQSQNGTTIEVIAQVVFHIAPEN